ncbi:serine/threonine-protein kinase DrkD [Acrasis kona]|uniref:Serine/threonine-protein kinase DrkD n=1 Tax=Acrasis kona TaxID=1008807 RepID=A0AAW2YQC3_9EUKA
MIADSLIKHLNLIVQIHAAVYEVSRFCFLLLYIVAYVTLTMMMKLSLRFGYKEYVAKMPDFGLQESLIVKELVVSRRSFKQDIEHFIIESSDLTFLSRISEGSYGVVFSGRYLGSQVAIKMMKRLESDHEFENEVKMLVELRHPNVVLFMGACISNDYKYIVTELMRYSLDKILYPDEHEQTLHDLSSVIHKALSVRKKIKIIKDIASALAFMNGREAPICHRDLKPSNILLCDNCSIAKVCDFGSSRKISNDMSRNIGTFTYMSPEMLTESTYTEKSDVYSFAIIMYELFFEIKPFHELRSDGDGFGDSEFLISVNVTKGNRPFIPEFLQISEKERLYLDLMQKCWAQNADERPSFSEILSMIELFPK